MNSLHLSQVAVTGAPGWLGSRLLSILHRREIASIRALALPALDLDRLRRDWPYVEWVQGDLRDPAALTALCRSTEGAVVIHAAGVIHPPKVRDFYAVNTEGTRNLLRAAKAAGVRRIVAVSSNSAIGVNPRRSQLLDESSAYAPYLHYGRSKMLMEQAVAAATADGAMQSVILRPCWYYGPGQPERQTLFFRMIREGRVPIVGDGHNLRSLSYVDDTAESLVQAARAPAAAGRTYWVADRRPYTMEEIIETIESLLVREFGLTVAHRRLRLPGIVGEAAYAFDRALQAAGIYNQKIHVLGELNKDIACSPERAIAELGLRPREELANGMRESIRWCLENGQRL